MFKYGGQDHFAGRFDFFEWSAPYYENSKEVCRALIEMDLVGKKLAAINAIGVCRDIGHEKGVDLYQTIINAGIDLSEKWIGDYPHIEDVLIPWNIVLCEPIQFVFDDGSTLEILPFEGGGARIGADSIPIGMIDGLNAGDINASEFFKELIGMEITRIGLEIKTNSVQYIDAYSIDGSQPYTETDTEYVIQFDLNSRYELQLIQSGEGWYKVNAGGDWRHQRVPYKRKKAVYAPHGQPRIINGRDYGGTFGIIGFCSEENRAADVPNLDCFGMAIDDYIVAKYLTEFLYTHLDPAIQEKGEHREPQFDWNDVNLYTFSTMRLMLDDIYRVMTLLQEDYNNPDLNEIKAHWCDAAKNRDDLSDAEINELRRALDFYKRFCSRMEHMLKIPGNDIMSFTGP